MESIQVASDCLHSAKSLSDQFYSNISRVRVVARVCLLAWFLDDGLTRISDFSSHAELMARAWSCGQVVASVVVMLNILGDVAAPCMIMARRQVLLVVAACCALALIAVVQAATAIMAYTHPLVGFFKEFSVVGGVLILLAESLVPEQSWEDPGEDRRRSVLQLVGRCLLVLMFVTHFYRLRYFAERMTPLLAVQEVVAGTFMVFVTLGYKTRANALALALFLTVFNIITHDWWNVADDGEGIESHRMFVRYNFFQCWTVVGGLLMVAILGPGDLSLDRAKKYL